MVETIPLESVIFRLIGTLDNKTVKLYSPWTIKYNHYKLVNTCVLL